MAWAVEAARSPGRRPRARGWRRGRWAGGGLGARCASAKAAEEREGTGEGGWTGAGGGRACAAIAKVAKREGMLKTERPVRGGQLAVRYLGARRPPLAEPDRRCGRTLRSGGVRDIALGRGGGLFIKVFALACVPLHHI